jgi:hypothetical protein
MHNSSSDGNGPQSWRAIISATCCNCCTVEGIHDGAAWYTKSHVNGGPVRGAIANPKIGLWRLAEPSYVCVPSYGCWDVSEKRVTYGGEGRGIEGFASREVADNYPSVINHLGSEGW